MEGAAGGDVPYATIFTVGGLIWRRVAIFADDMKCNAITIANEIIRTAMAQGRNVTPLQLMKLTYIAYGVGLAEYPGTPMIDPRFDSVEAWRLGPVIPSVYHTFKHFGAQPVTELGTVLRPDGGCERPSVETPLFGGAEGDDRRASVIRFTWRRYGMMAAGDLVYILHSEGTPWQLSYKEGMNARIPERLTRRYYEILLEEIRRNYARRNEKVGA